MALDSRHEQGARSGDDPRADNPYVILPDIVRGIIDAMNAGNIRELEIEHKGLRLVLKTLPANSPPGTGVVTVDGSEPVGEPAPTLDETIYLITAPMIGTFYIAPAPGEPPFIQPGDPVTEGQTIGIIEAMKIMNEIAADRSGEVVEILAENGQTVEYGSPLARLRVDG